ncbi:MAG: flavin reductase family protein [Chloroflexota bacterium]
MDLVSGEALRNAMRHWTTGVAVLTSRIPDMQHGMTVNSFTSISLDPPLVCVTLANTTRTRNLVEQSGIFGVTILAEDQVEIANRFAGWIPENEDRMAGIETYTLVSGSPLLTGGLVGLDCKVVHRYPMKDSTLYIGEVVAIQHQRTEQPLVYHNRVYHRLCDGGERVNRARKTISIEDRTRGD